MTNFRYYGSPPYRVAVVHGGPGAAGEMAPVARTLATGRGVIEPLQTAVTLDGQVEELLTVLEDRCDLPVTLIGHSWGAWLSCLAAAHRPSIVKHLVLVGAGPFDAAYVTQMEVTRHNRLSVEEKQEMTRLAQELDAPDTPARDRTLARLGQLAARTDTFDPLLPESDDLADPLPSAAIFKGVWTAAALLRESGALLEQVRLIKAPVTAIHGDYDPHPAEGVRVPLEGALDDFRFVLLERCGHTPWVERHARTPFYRELERILS